MCAVLQQPVASLTISKHSKQMKRQYWLEPSLPMQRLIGVVRAHMIGGHQMVAWNNIMCMAMDEFRSNVVT